MSAREPSVLPLFLAPRSCRRAAVSSLSAGSHGGQGKACRPGARVVPSYLCSRAFILLARSLALVRRSPLV